MGETYIPLMKYLLLLICLLVGGVSAAQVSGYPQAVFDADTCCWRLLSKEGRNEEAGQLILDYIAHNKGKVNTHALYWHAGQVFAKAGDKARAKKSIRKTYSVLYRWFGGEDGRTWYYYARGTVAFLDRDRRRLQKLIRQWDRKKYEQDKNYRQLQLMLRNWEWTYEKALAE